MKVLSYDALARNFPKVWANIESTGEEVVVTRNRRRVARIVPEAERMDAFQIFADLEGVLGENAGAALARKVAESRRKNGRKGTCATFLFEPR